MPLVSDSSMARDFVAPSFSTEVSLGRGNTTAGPRMKRLLPSSSREMQYSSRSSVTASLRLVRDEGELVRRENQVSLPSPVVCHVDLKLES